MTGSSDLLVCRLDDTPALRPEELTALLGAKAAGLAAMTGMGLPVPPGFVLTVGAALRHRASGWDRSLVDAVRSGIASLEVTTGRRLGDRDHPLVVSVRSGAAVSMPGMLDTVLDVGMNAATEAALATATGDPGFARDTHLRFLRSWCALADGGRHGGASAAAGDAGLPSEARARLAQAGVVVPDDPFEQLLGAIAAVIASFDGDRARHYRAVESADWATATAVTVQAMVFGNLGSDSGSGVCFSRDPSTGEPGIVGDFLVGSQGEDVVGGTHLTDPLGVVAQRWPSLFAELVEAVTRLERHLDDLVDVEFTIEQGRLWLLQVRRGKRSPLAAFRVAVDLAEDPTSGLDRAGAVERCRVWLADPPTEADPEGTQSAAEVVGTGVGASPGVATGVLAVDVDDAIARSDAGESVVLARVETSPADIAGISASVALVTCRGGLVSHAAVVARSWGMPCIVGATALRVEPDGLHTEHGFLPVGTTVTVDGDRGELVLGWRRRQSRLPDAVRTVLAWAGMSVPEALAEPAASTGSGAGDAAAAPVVGEDGER